MRIASCTTPGVCHVVAEDKAALIETMRIGAKIQVEQFLIVNEEKNILKCADFGSWKFHSPRVSDN